MTIIGLDHVQIAAPAGCETDTRRFYVSDPFSNRVEIRAR